MEAAWDYSNPREYLQRARRQEFPPLIISVAITGGLQGAETNPAIPETPAEQAEATREAYEAGASIVHVHARDPDRGYAYTSPKAADYQKANDKIREACPEIIINNSTGGGPDLSREERLRSIEADPEIATLNMGPLAIRTTLKDREPPLEGRDEPVDLDVITDTGSLSEIEHFAQAMHDRGVKPELEIYHPGNFDHVYRIVDSDYVDPPYFLQFVMGMPSGVQPTPQSLLFSLQQAPPDSMINVAGVGPHQLPMVTLGIMLGLHVRVGLEDNIYFRRGEMAESNAQIVERVVRIAEEFNRPIASPEQAREMLDL
jgi:3-keto-5-aminohexanoate cleavage enzyme